VPVSELRLPLVGELVVRKHVVHQPTIARIRAANPLIWPGPTCLGSVNAREP